MSHIHNYTIYRFIQYNKKCFLQRTLRDYVQMGYIGKIIESTISRYTYQAIVVLHTTLYMCVQYISMIIYFQITGDNNITQLVSNIALQIKIR